MTPNIQVGEPLEDQATPTSSASKNWLNTIWGFSSTVATFCLLFVTFVIASSIVLSLIPLYLTKKELNGIDIDGSSATFDVIYQTGVTDGTSLTITDLKTLSHDMSKAFHLKSVIVNSAKFVSQSSTNTKKKRRSAKINNLQYQNEKDVIGDLLDLSLTIKNTGACLSSDCNKAFIAMAKKNIDTVYNNINLNLKFTNGETRNVQLTFSSYELPIPRGSTSSTSQSTSISTTPTTKSTSILTTPTTKLTSLSTAPTTKPTTQPIITQCQSSTSANVVNQIRTSQLKSGHKKMKMQSAPSVIGDSVLLKNAYLVEFALDTHVKHHFRTIANSLKATYGIDESAIKQRRIIQSSLFSGISFSLTVEHSTDALEMIEEATAIYPIYTVQAPTPITEDISSDILNSNSVDSINSHNLTGVTQVHNEFQNFGKGVRVAIIDDGIYYLHPALGGCFGVGCKVAFGYDFIGDNYTSLNPIIMPDDDPLDNCTIDSHGTHVAGIIAANTTGINDTVFIPGIPFIGVAPQVTIGAYRVFGCDGSTATDLITDAIYRAYDDKADIINLSLGDGIPYPESSDAIAVQRVADVGVYVVVAMGNSGGGGLQTGGQPANAPNVMAIGSVDTIEALTLLIMFAPDGSKILYQPLSDSSGWPSILDSTIVVNDPNQTINDGCLGPSKSVSGAVVLFFFSVEDSCDFGTRCLLAIFEGAIGCLGYGLGQLSIGPGSGVEGAVSLQNGLSIVATVTANPAAIYTFTNFFEPSSSETGGTPSYFTSFGLTGDLWLKPQISGIGGEVYSTISLYRVTQKSLSRAYAIDSGTSMACPYTAGVLALFLASIGNPAPNTTTGIANDGICRPNFSVATNIFQSSAMPVNIYNSSLFATTAQQGAGLVNAYQALTFTTIFSPSQLSLNDTVRIATSYTVNLWNIGNTTGVYKITHVGAALATGKNANQDQLLNTPLYSADYAVVNIDPTEFQLDSGESRAITLQFQAPAAADPTLLPIYSGFIYATNTVNGQVAHLSYAGVVGNYGNASIIVRDNSSVYTTGVYDSKSQYAFNEQLPIFNVTNQYGVSAVLAWGTRLLFVEVVSAQDDGLSGFNSSYGLVFSTNDDSAFYATNIQRNVKASSIQSFSMLYLKIWNGYVCPTILGANCTNLQASLVPAGQYKIRFSALQHFGNATNPADFDIYRTPPFNLVY